MLFKNSKIQSKISILFGQHQAFFICFFLIIITLAIYWPVRSHDFVYLDDYSYVFENFHVQDGITLDSVAWAFTTVHSANWHPLTWLSHILDCQLFGLNPGRHHLTNLFFHISNTLLLFFIFRKMTGRQWESAFIAALFAVHPLHVESVAWISERKDVLSTFFFMLTVWYYIGYAKNQAICRYLLVLLVFSLGLMSKPMLVTLPFVLLLLDFWPLNRFGFQKLSCSDSTQKKETVLHLIGEKIPLFVLAVLSSCITFYAQKHGEAVIPLVDVSLKSRIMVALVAYAGYIEKMVYPVKLAVFYPYPKIIPWFALAGAALLLFFLSFLSIIFIKKRPYFIVGWLWYLGTLVPVIGLIQVGSQSMADRYTYIPLIGLFIIPTWGMPELLAKWRYGKKFLAVFAVILIALSVIKTYQQVGYWKNNFTLFGHAIEVTSDNALSHNLIGNALIREGRTEEAIRHYEQAVKIIPEYAEAHVNLGCALNKQGRSDEAIDQYIQALKIKPEYAEAEANFGNALSHQDHTDEAIKHYLKALSVKPDYVEAQVNLGAALDKEGRINEAIQHYLKGLAVKPDDKDLHFNLGVALDKAGRIDEAITHYLNAIQIKPDFAEAHVNLGNALNSLGHTDQAIPHYLNALQIKPNYVEAHFNLGNALYRQGHIDEAIMHYLAALKIKPDFAEAYNSLGVAYIRKGNIEGAIANFQQALCIKPDYVIAKNNLNKAVMIQH